jgi:hypothetical protein
MTAVGKAGNQVTWNLFLLGGWRFPPTLPFPLPRVHYEMWVGRFRLTSPNPLPCPELNDCRLEPAGWACD